MTVHTPPVVENATVADFEDAMREVQDLADRGDDFAAGDIYASGNSRIVTMAIHISIRDKVIERIGWSQPACKHERPLALYRGVA